MAGGRPKGARNKRNLNVEMIASQYDIDPFEVLMMIVNNDREGLGLNDAYPIPIKERCLAAKEACRYLYSQKQAIEVSTGENGFKVIIEDYSRK